MDTIRGLQNLGLSEKEARVYLSLLELPSASAYSVAKRSGLKKPTAYVILDELVEKGMVIKIPRARKKLYAARSPLEIFSAAEERLNTSKRILPELMALTEKKHGAVRTRYFEGLEQVKQAYFDTLARGDRELRGWISDAPFRVINKDFWYKEYQQKRLKAEIKARIIVPKTDLMRAYGSDDKETLKETRVDASATYQPSSEMVLYGGDRVVITSFEEMMALIIESEKIHDLVAGIFEAHWRSIGKG